MTLFDFPPEIINLFIEAVESDGGEIAPLLSVSKVFYYPIKERIFRHVHWTVHVANANDPRTACLLDVLQNDPTTASIVQHVSIEIIMKGRSRSTLLEDPKFAAVLSILTHSPIHTLEIRGTKLFPIPSLPMQSIEHLLRIRCNTVLQTLILDGLAYPPRLLLTGVPSTDKLITLFLGRIDITNHQHLLDPYSPFTAEDLPGFLHGAYSPSAPPPFRTLTSLTTNSPSSYLSYVMDRSSSADLQVVSYPEEIFALDVICSSLPAFELPSLTTYTADTKSLPLLRLAIGQILKTLPALETLVLLDKYDDQMFDGGSFETLCTQIRQLWHLRKMHLQDSTSSLYAFAPQDIASFLQLCRPLPALEILIVELRFSLFYNDDPVRYLDNPSLGWAHLRQTFSLMPTLTSVELRITVFFARWDGEGEGFDPEACRESLEQLMKGIMMDPRLNITFGLTLFVL